MTGMSSGTVTRNKDVAKCCDSNHRIHHICTLVTNGISASLKLVLDEAGQIINFIKTRSLQPCALCDDMGSH